MPSLKDILRARTLEAAEVGQTVAEVARRMAERNIGAIVVLEKGELRGIFSERDLMKRIVVQRLDPEATRVEAVMSTELSTADESATVEEAMELMRRRGCRHLPVMRSGGVIGFISMRDLMLCELERKTEEIAHMRSYIQGA
ncbi:MAG: CBS domain-containing protein [Bryobacteraceae bacterium]|jgi:CBS domain-containing protein